jgi:uncharacterized membrane protein
MIGLYGLDREGLLDSVVNVVPLAMIVLLTLLFVAYNPWGWRETGVVVIVFGLHLIPILTLVPVTYLFVKVVREAGEGRSNTADRVKSWFVSDDGVAGDVRADENPTADE